MTLKRKCFLKKRKLLQPIKQCLKSQIYSKPSNKKISSMATSEVMKALVEFRAMEDLKKAVKSPHYILLKKEVKDFESTDLMVQIWFKHSVLCGSFNKIAISGYVNASDEDKKVLEEKCKKET